MPSKIPENLRPSVIQGWLQGEQRDKIASDTGLSAGAVTNIISEWKQGLGSTIAEESTRTSNSLEKGWYECSPMCHWV